ncbi:putative quinol monooxygenase [Amphritea pacifica]|uniref:putative quinol monooxygenase n=1 Tax=Amphritea pacifica TaxID=2811233 RepID=UPI002FCDD30E
MISTVRLTGFIRVPESDLDAVIRELMHHQQLTLSEPGCLRFEVTQCQTDPCRFDVFEEFSDSDSFQAHQVRTRSSYWAQVTANAERNYQVETIK